LPAGKKVKCPKCATIFAPEDEATTAPVAAATTKDAEDDEATADAGDAAAEEDATEEADDARPARKRRAEAEAAEAEAAEAEAAEAEESEEDATEEDATEEDEPRRKKKRRRKEADEDEDEPEPARRPARKRRSWGTIAGMAGVGMVMLFIVCGSCGGLGFWVWTMVRGGPSIVGRWESVTQLPLGLKIVYQFDEAGRGSRQISGIKMMNNPRPHTFTYKIDDKNLVITPDEQPDQGDLGGGVEIPKDVNFKFTVRYTVRFQNTDEMTWIGGALPLTFRRVK
jgi:hypothetical protein